MTLSVVKHERFWWTVSILITIAGIAAMLLSFTQIGSPLRPALDFIGGTRLQLELDCSIPNNCQGPISVEVVRELLKSQNLGDSSIQVIGEHGLSIRSKSLDPDQRTKLQQALEEKIGKFDQKLTQIDSVGPTVGKDLLNSGIIALIVAFFAIVVYLSLRFQLDYAIFAVIALLHDVMITVSVFAILGLVTHVEVDSLFLVALLTIIGFSVNDTVVIYDRIRENLQKYPDEPIDHIIDDSVNQTLGRSINTILTVLLTLVAIFLFGGETLKLFALALIIGFVCGGYSSIFIASTLLGWWRRRNEKNSLKLKKT
ncbi:MAG: protein translocase subunit SecF [Cyanobacteriota bacterium ELA615]